MALFVTCWYYLALTSALAPHTAEAAIFFSGSAAQSGIAGSIWPTVPPGSMQAQGPEDAVSSEASKIAGLFSKLDVNGDGEVDVHEFVVAEKNGVLPTVPGPAPAPAAAVLPGTNVTAASVNATHKIAELKAHLAGSLTNNASSWSTSNVSSWSNSTSSVILPSSSPPEVLPPHLRKPPPLPDNIPEPPPPPRAPPPEPLPPPLPPQEGQMVGPPPSDESLEASGNLAAVLEAAPALDLDGVNPVQVPAPPDPLEPPSLPRLAKPFAAPQSLPEHLMQPSPVAFGVDSVRALPAKLAALTAWSFTSPLQGQMSADQSVSQSSQLRVFLQRRTSRHTKQ
jgi:hypothetical protein